MDFSFTEEQNMLRDMVRKFTVNEVKPVAAAIDREKRFPHELVQKAAELGLLGIPFPEKYGGSEAGEVGYMIMLEEISRGCASTTVTIGAHVGLAGMALFLGASDEQKEKYIPDIASGRKLAAFSLTEPQAGSDASNIQTTAVEDGDFYVLNGNKIWTTNGDVADVVIVFALTNKELRAHGGITAFILDKGTEGFSIGKIEDKMGIRGSSTAELIFQDVRIPKANVLGKVGLGFVVAMQALDIARLSLAAGCIGAAKELLDLSLDFAKKRVQFGKPIATKQAIQWMLAEMASDIFAMESMSYRTAWMVDQGINISKEGAICKMFASEALDRVVDKAMQIHGGLGYMTDYPIERFYRDARINKIFEGTNEIQRLVIAEELLKQ